MLPFLYTPVSNHYRNIFLSIESLTCQKDTIKTILSTNSIFRKEGKRLETFFHEYHEWSFAFEGTVLQNSVSLFLALIRMKVSDFLFLKIILQIITKQPVSNVWVASFTLEDAVKEINSQIQPYLYSKNCLFRNGSISVSFLKISGKDSLPQSYLSQRKCLQPTAPQVSSQEKETIKLTGGSRRMGRGISWNRFIWFCCLMEWKAKEKRQTE